MFRWCCVALLIAIFVFEITTYPIDTLEEHYVKPIDLNKDPKKLNNVHDEVDELDLVLVPEKKKSDEMKTAESVYFRPLFVYRKHSANRRGRY
ncbi:hypothetical protein ABEB36_002522 [Hypothenemus hampei]|uniref:Uncharacterized protein n=1 Tax=Hypothenemus hampei TaxID=57062 RepID=A0ABD1F615_HYPHA